MAFKIEPDKPLSFSNKRGKMTNEVMCFGNEGFYKKHGFRL